MVAALITMAESFARLARDRVFRIMALGITVGGSTTSGPDITEPGALMVG